MFRGTLSIHKGENVTLEMNVNYWLCNWYCHEKQVIIDCTGWKKYILQLYHKWSIPALLEINIEEEKKDKTYIDVVFIVPHSDIVEKSSFIQVHKRAWGSRKKQKHEFLLVITIFSKVRKLLQQPTMYWLTVVIYKFVDIILCWEDLAHWSKKCL